MSRQRECQDTLNDAELSNNDIKGMMLLLVILQQISLHPPECV